MNKLKELFDENSEYNKRLRIKAKEIEKNLIQKRKGIKFERSFQTKEGKWIYKNIQFGSFIGDCESCKYFEEPCYNFVTGGRCILHNIDCGYGFTCFDCTNEYGITKEEIMKIK